MDKGGISYLGVQKKKIKRHSRKKKLLNKIVDFLKSDSYLFAPLVSSQLSDLPPTTTIPTSPKGVVVMNPGEEENNKLPEKVVDYLKADSYMYAPLIGSQLSSGVDVNTANPHSGPVRHLKTATAEVSIRKITKKTNQPPEDTIKIIQGDEPSEKTRLKSRIAVQRTVAQRETVKHLVHQHCRSSIPGKGILRTEPRKLVVE